jgi:hypothetical protein
MASIHETAYPRLRSDPDPRELAALYTPSAVELAFAAAHTHANTVAREGLLI